MIRLIDLLKEASSQSFYRAVTTKDSDTVLFEPKGYYEAIDDNGNPITTRGDVLSRSNVPEVAASKTVGGAVLGAWSMLRHHGKLSSNTKIYIYKINQTPDKDLSHIHRDDFEWLQEVRYKTAVEGSYVGLFVYNKVFNDDAENFYNRLVDDDPWSEIEIDIDKWEDFEHMILTMKESDLQ